MKSLYTTFILLFVINSAFAQLVWVGIRGQTEFCPGDNREVSYILNGNVQVHRWRVQCYRCDIYVNGQWQREDTGIQNGAAPNSISIRWDAGNYDDPGLGYWVYGKNPYPFWNFVVRTDEAYIKLVENTRGVNVYPTISSSISSLACGSTQSFTFTANWKNANSYSWSVSGGTISGSSTGATITVIPTNGSSNVTANVRGYNTSCNVYSPWRSRTVTRSAPVVSDISGPDNICYGAPSVVNHSVNYINGATYLWYSFPTGKIDVVSGQSTRSATIKGTSVGSFDIKVEVTACGQQVTRTKTVYSDDDAPEAPYIYDMPYRHCAGDCEDYIMEVPFGYAAEYQFRYNYGYWDYAHDDGSFTLCTDTYDYGYNTLELRAKGICGNYSSIYTESIYLDYCYYMMSMSAEDSLLLTEMSKESNDLLLYPNPASVSMSVLTPEGYEENEVSIINDKNEIVARFKKSKRMFAIDTQRLTSGYYYLIVANKKGKKTKRFLVE